MMVIAVCNNKGGAGKTASTRHLAGCMAATGRKVAVMDLDGQANLTDSLLGVRRGERPTPNMADVLAQKATLDVVSHWASRPGVWVYPSDGALDDAADDLVTAPLGVLRLKAAIERHRNSAEVLLIDCPPNVGALTFSALIASDYVIIPTAPSPWSINGVFRIREKIGEVKAALGKGPEVIGVIATQVRSTVEHSECLAQLSEGNMPLLLGAIPYRGGVDADRALAEAYAPIVETVLPLIERPGQRQTEGSHE